MAFGSIHIPNSSTHSHSHTQKSNQHHSSSQSSDHSPSPGHLPHASTLPAASHKHYTNRELHHNNSDLLPHLQHPTTVNPATYLSSHRHEHKLQHSFRDAKRAASLSHSSAQIPDYHSSLPADPNPSANATILTTPTSNTNANTISAEPLTLTSSQQDLADQRIAEQQEQARKHHQEQDQATWDAIVRSREAAARRSTLDATVERPQINE